MIRFKAIFTVFALLLGYQTISSQILEPVKWKFSVETIDKNEAEVVATAKIDKKWHVYALEVSDDPDAIGPIPTTMELDKSEHFKTKGKVTEGKFITHYDPNFEMDLNYFENSATFKQRIKIKSDEAFTIKGTLNYMACDDQRCIFPDPEIFELKVVPPGAMPVEEEKTLPIPPVKKEKETVATTNENGSEMFDPIKWTFSSVKNENGEYDIILKATIDEGWYLYSQTLDVSAGPEPTKVKLKTPAGVALKGNVTESIPLIKHDPNYMLELPLFKNEAVFTQTISGGQDNLKIPGSVTFMVCNEERCLTPKTIDFEIDLATGKGYEVDPVGEIVELGDKFVMPLVDLDQPVSDCGQEKQSQSLWAIFLFGIIGGLLALLTPCVFPMIPLTVSFFTKGSEGNKGKTRATTYGFFILLIYFVLSLPFHLSKNVDPEVLNSIATNVWLNVGFFVIFIVFAISFFGFFEITLPSGFANRVDKASNVGGLIGIFFMALTLAIVSFSCTGPILGSVIGSIYSSDVTGLVNIAGLEMSLPAAKVSSAMLGFGLALGAPFGLFAAFPGMLKRLPKSGGWLQDFKVSLGFLELAFALKFLSNSDLVEQWGIIKREIFFGIWILIGVLWVLYMLGVFTFKKGYTSTTKLKGFKLYFTIALALFTVRLIPGVLPHSNLSRFDFLSGFPPPKFYSFYPYHEEFKIYRTLEEGMAVAKESGKPIFLDFTGWACVNCRKMEDTVWPEDEVKSLLAEKFVIVSLYVDEKIELPAEEQFIYETRDGRKKQIKTVGNKWATLQTETFENNSQPFYALLSPEGHLLAPPRQYTPNAQQYADWLTCGLSAFENWESDAPTAMK